MNAVKDETMHRTVMRLIVSLPALGLVVAMFGTTFAADAEDAPRAMRASVVIGRDAPAIPYDRMIFGGFLEHFDNQIYGGVFDPGSPLADAQGLRKDVIAALKELKVSVIRWPGGCFVDGYHWQKGVGTNREAYDDPRWGEREPNTFGTDEFIAFCRRVGAAPYICQNSYASVPEMANWVAYCNATEGEFADLRRHNGHPEPYGVKFWSVGNERFDKAFITRVRDAAQAMKQVDPSILVTCPGTLGGLRSADFKISSNLLAGAGAQLDFLSVHDYRLLRGKELPSYSYLNAITESEAPDANLTAVCGSIAAAGLGNQLKIAMDEWNLRCWQHPGFPRNSVKNFADPALREMVEKRRQQNDLASQYTMADALFTASFLNACLRHSGQVTMGCIAPLVNTRGPLFVYSNGIVKRTHFHTLAMYANLLQDQFVVSQVTADKLTEGGKSVAVVDALATVDKSGKQWAIALINRHPTEAVLCEVKLGDVTLNGKFKATQLAGDSPDAYNDIEHPNRVVPESRKLVFAKGAVSLPPHSLTIIKVPLQ